jgi:GDP-mannose 6-dehydrogenase
VKNQRISIFGLGYVGLTNAACFAAKGHKVIGVDVKSWKVDELNQGRSPVMEEGLGSRIQQAVKKGLLSATTDAKTAILNSEISLICVGTPSNSSGGIDLTNISRVAEDIGMSLRDKNDYHLVVVRSTVIPGTTGTTITPLLERRSRRKASADFGICVNPEFLREGSMIEDFINAEMILVGELDKRSGDLLEGIYSDFNARIIRVDIKTAEIVKYVFNAFHAMKTSFINEIGNICQAHGIDTHVVSEILCSDHKLNISPKYLRPGFAFGGSCLPKDLRAMVNQSKQAGYTPHLLESVLMVNESQKEKALSLIKTMAGPDIGNKTIAIIGAAYKENTDDIRESPAVHLIGELIKGESKVKVYDPLALDNLRAHFEDRILYSASLEETLTGADLCVVALNYVRSDELGSLINLMSGKNILDLVGIAGRGELSRRSDVNYVAICW